MQLAHRCVLVLLLAAGCTARGRLHLSRSAETQNPCANCDVDAAVDYQRCALIHGNPCVEAKKAQAAMVHKKPSCTAEKEAMNEALSKAYAAQEGHDHEKIEKAAKQDPAYTAAATAYDGCLKSDEENDTASAVDPEAHRAAIACCMKKEKHLRCMDCKNMGGCGSHRNYEETAHRMEMEDKYGAMGWDHCGVNEHYYQEYGHKKELMDAAAAARAKGGAPGEKERDRKGNVIEHPEIKPLRLGPQPGTLAYKKAFGDK